jgi:transposase
MKPYSQDLRVRALAAVQAGEHSQAHIAKQFKISLATLENWLRRQRDTGSAAALPHGGGRTRTLQGCDAFLRAEVKLQPDVTLQELQTRVAEAKGLNVSPSMLCRELQRLKLPRKKRRSTIASGTRRG